MVVFKRYGKVLTKRIQLVIMKVRYNKLCQKHRIHYCRVIFYSKSFSVIYYKACIKPCIVCNHDGITAEFKKFWKNLFYRFRLHNHGIVNSRKFFYSERNRNLRIYKFAEIVYNLTIFYLYGTYLDNSVNFCRKSRSLQVKYNKRIIEILPH